jgi:hypothetical protein
MNCTIYACCTPLTSYPTTHPTRHVARPDVTFDGSYTIETLGSSWARLQQTCLCGMNLRIVPWDSCWPDTLQRLSPKGLGPTSSSATDKISSAHGATAPPRRWYYTTSRTTGFYGGDLNAPDEANRSVERDLHRMTSASVPSSTSPPPSPKWRCI